MECTLTQEKVSSVITWSVRVMVIIAILAFFLPYVSCSAGVTKVVISSAELAVGADKEVEISIFGYSDSETVPLDPQPSLFLFLILPVVAGALSLLKEQIAKGLAYLIEGIAFLLFNNHVLQAMRSKLTYGEYDLSRYTLNTEIGYKLCLFHGWAMILLGVAGIVGWYYFLSKKRTDTVSVVDSDAASKVFSKPISSAHSQNDPDPSLSETKEAAPKNMSDQADLSMPQGSARLVTNLKPVDCGTSEKASDHCAPSQEKDSDDSPFSPPTGF